MEDRVLTLDEVLARIDAVSTEDVQKVAQRLFAQEKLNLAVVGPYETAQEAQFKGLLTL
ncbi:MAG: hypothetical protein GTO63_04495 [Anaerolineae bacterium]|nr:hypothetical protein [Anaerolineae bacterium]NIN94260.1 hypothetical protein [Anaerolineae bacterium]NIQ77328.1 hypothetical protein [Anaerolineae bacterium]